MKRLRTVGRKGGKCETAVGQGMSVYLSSSGVTPGQLGEEPGCGLGKN